jgi:L-ascorbate metabolism protein UlaG (beta-lactamase superfamily)
MRIRWLGHAAFLLDGPPRVLIDPFGPLPGLAGRGMRFDYPPLAGVEADLLLVTHEHPDHNHVAAAAGTPHVLRSLAGTFAGTPAGDVVAVASEHDPEAGTRRGHNVMYRFALGGLRVAHLGDLGQAAIRPEQVRALGEVDVLFVPVGGGPTVGGAGAADVVRALAPRLVVPMHHRTPLADFLEPPDAFLDALGARTVTVDASEAEAGAHLGTADDPVVLLLRPPGV